MCYMRVWVRDLTNYPVGCARSSREINYGARVRGCCETRERDPIRYLFAPEDFLSARARRIIAIISRARPGEACLHVMRLAVERST